eukprot:2751781-Ditylum_brightwellii.AAC.1
MVQHQHGGDDDGTMMSCWCLGLGGSVGIVSSVLSWTWLAANDGDGDDDNDDNDAYGAYGAKNDVNAPSHCHPPLL